MQLTRSQNKALDLNRHLAVIANAGSGKTQVLVKRYVKIFLEHPELTVRNVVAITFTESAAAELKSRIRQEIQSEIIATAVEDHSKRSILRLLESGLPNAFIGTIHAFASRLLRSYPIEANIDAGFQIVNGPPQSLMQADVIRRVFFRLLENEYQSDFETPILKTFRTYGREELSEIIRTLLCNRAKVSQLEESLFGKADDEVLHYWENAIVDVFADFLSDETVAFFDGLLMKLQPKYKASEDVRIAYKLFLSSRSQKDSFEQIDRFSTFVKTLFRQDDLKLKNKTIAYEDIDADVQERIIRFTNGWKQLQSLTKILPKSSEQFDSEHQEYLNHLRQVLIIYHEVLEEYTLQKTEFGLIDFDDLILQLNDLLHNDAVREELSEKFRFIMVDEYQDTDHTQLQILSQLSANFGEKTKVMVVGDPKQSIFRFRNAEASVFARTLVRIRSQKLGKLSEEASIFLGMEPSEEKGELVLPESFRMAKAPLAFVNEKCGNFMKVSSGEFGDIDFPYVPLVAGRDAKIEGSVEWLLSDVRDSGSIADTTEDDPFEGAVLSKDLEQLAQKIVNILGSQSGRYQIEDKEGLRAPRPSDIAILLRSRSKLLALERALKAYHIPYVANKGTGFYSQQEIVDLISYLRFIVDPSDDVSFLGVLRSPFFSISDPTLLQIARNTQAEYLDQTATSMSFWERTQIYAGRCADPALHRAVQVIEENIRVALRLPVATVVSKLLSDSGLYGILSSSLNSAQQIANIEKFLDAARLVDSTGMTTLNDFVDELVYLSEQESSEPQGDVARDETRIQIMTIHSAKGLEFPIVIIANIDGRFTLDHVRILDNELGLMLKNWDGSDSKYAISELIRLRSVANAEAEEKRILYVAMTRAQDHLILSGKISKVNSKSFLQFLTSPAAPESLLERVSEVFHTSITRYNPDFASQSVQELYELVVPITTAAPERKTMYEGSKNKETERQIVIDLAPVKGKPKLDRYSPTQLLTFANCPTKYHLTYALGLPQEPRLGYDMVPEEHAERVQGILMGQILHKLLEQILAIATDQEIIEDIFKKTFEKITEDLGLYDFNELRPYYTRCRADINRVLASGVVQNIRASPKKYFEFSLRSLFGDDVLFGVIDCLFQNTDGSWTIIDYKTSSDTRNSGLLQQYKFQLHHYAYLVQKYLGGEPSIEAKIIFTRTGEQQSWIFTPNSFSQFESDLQISISDIREQERLRSLTDLKQNLEHCPECHFFLRESGRCIVTLEAQSEPQGIAQLV